MAEGKKVEVFHFKPGEVILSEGQFGSALFIIKKGQVEISTKGKQGVKVPLAIINSGEFLGEIAVLTQKPTSGTATALTEVEAHKLSREAIAEQLKDAPTWLVSLTMGALHRLQKMDDIIRRNGWVDDQLNEAIKAVQAKFPSTQPDTEKKS